MGTGCGRLAPTLNGPPRWGSHDGARFHGLRAASSNECRATSFTTGGEARSAPEPTTPTTPTAPGTPATRTPTIPTTPAIDPLKTFTATTAFTLPAGRRCLKRPARLTVTYRRVKGVTVDRVEVWLGTKRLIRRTGTAARRSFTLRRLPSKRFTLTLKVTPRGGRTVTARRAYRVC